MDYLDPAKKKAHKTRLLIGYGLFAVVISIATIILVYVANGYYIDRSTGSVIQNGLVYLDTKPVAADIYLNGKKQRGTTDARLVMPAGTYTFDLKREGYREWSRTFILEGGSLRKLTYARLIPQTLRTTEMASLRSNPVRMSQSIDKKWLVASHADDPLRLSLINMDQPEYVVSELSLPKSLVTNPTAGTLEVLEWSSNNRYFLATYTSGSEVSYLRIDRTDANATRNLNIQFSDKTLEVAMQDRNSDRYFVYDPESRALSQATLDNGIEPKALLTEVIDYKAYANDWIVYITKSDTEGMVTARFQHGSNDMKLKDLKQAPVYYLELAKSGNAPVLGISSSIENRALVYNDPEKYLRENKDATLPVATAVLRVNDPVGLTISSDSSVIMSYGKENMASHEFEEDRSYNFKAQVALADDYAVRWLDGRHFVFISGEKHFMQDFDGSNRYEITGTARAINMFTDEDFTNMVYFTPARVDAAGTLTAAKVVTANVTAP